MQYAKWEGRRVGGARLGRKEDMDLCGKWDILYMLYKLYVFVVFYCSCCNTIPTNGFRQVINAKLCTCCTHCAKQGRRT